MRMRIISLATAFVAALALATLPSSLGTGGSIVQQTAFAKRGADNAPGDKGGRGGSDNRPGDRGGRGKSGR